MRVPLSHPDPCLRAALRLPAAQPQATWSVLGLLGCPGQVRRESREGSSHSLCLI